MPSETAISSIIDRQGLLILDGGLATELEREGFKLNHKLWSAQVMRTNPYAIKKVHRAYLRAGADCIITASYQITYAGCREVGMKDWEIKALLESSVQVAHEARTEFSKTIAAASRPLPLVAASIGPYGAYLANGAEYTGDYGISKEELKAFHEPRWKVLAKTKADLFVCETIPNYQEAKVLSELIEDHNVQAIVSFSCQDDKAIHDGTSIEECVSLFKDSDKVIGIGVNCTAPKHIGGLVKRIKSVVKDKPVSVYPNSGELYNPETRAWECEIHGVEFAEEASTWQAAGAQLIGGCCRTSPTDISAIRKSLLDD